MGSSKFILVILGSATIKRLKNTALCNVAKLKGISGLPKKPNILNLGIKVQGGGRGADTCQAQVAQLVSYKEGGKFLIANLDPINFSFFVPYSAVYTH